MSPVGMWVGVLGRSTDLRTSATKIEPSSPDDRLLLFLLSFSLVGVFDYQLVILPLSLCSFSIVVERSLLILALVGVLEACLMKLSRVLDFSGFFLFFEGLPFTVHLMRILDFFYCCYGVL